MTRPEIAPRDVWTRLRHYTPARIAIGRSGGSLPTRETLDFAFAHALARDAVHTPFDHVSLAAQLAAIAGRVLPLLSMAADRPTYLARPDLGRRLSPESAAQLAALNARPGDFDLVVIVSDGLSASAAQRQAQPLLAALLPCLREAGFRLAPLCCVRHARVALQDQVGELLRASQALILLGERPGLGTPDSLGAYFVYNPRSGRTDADRNCVSNIRPEGLPPAKAAERLSTLLQQSRQRGISGTALKENWDLVA